MLDIETFSRRADAAVFEVAIVPFDDRGMVDQVECGRDLGHWQWTPRSGNFEGETVAWWMQRGGRPDINAANGPGEAEVVGKIYEYLARFPESELWSGPSSFDCVILQQLFERYSHKMPVGFRQYRDLTTLRAAAGFPVVPRTHKKHEAFNDCLHQIAVWAECRRILGLSGGQPSRSLPSTPAPESAETTGTPPAPPTTRQFAGPTEGCPNYTPSGLRTSLPTAQEFAEASVSLARGTPGLRGEMSEPAEPDTCSPPDELVGWTDAGMESVLVDLLTALRFIGERVDMTMFQREDWNEIYARFTAGANVVLSRPVVVIPQEYLVRSECGSLVLHVSYGGHHHEQRG
jgi:hypothetical protein